MILLAGSEKILVTFTLEKGIAMLMWMLVRIEAKRQAQWAWNEYNTRPDPFDGRRWYLDRGAETTSRDDAFWARVAPIAGRILERRLCAQKVSVHFAQVYDKWDNLMRSPYLIVS